jgi:hypothetical protein
MSAASTSVDACASAMEATATMEATASVESFTSVETGAHSRTEASDSRPSDKTSRPSTENVTMEARSKLVNKMRSAEKER